MSTINVTNQTPRPASLSPAQRAEGQAIDMTPKTHPADHASQTGPATNPDANAYARQAANGEILDSRKLFGSRTEIGILHDGSLYRLKITRQGKLILNK
jgi:hemin uptake protein HemP